MGVGVPTNSGREVAVGAGAGTRLWLADGSHAAISPSKAANAIRARANVVRLLIAGGVYAAPAYCPLTGPGGGLGATAGVGVAVGVDVEVAVGVGVEVGVGVGAPTGVGVGVGVGTIGAVTTLVSP